jgi:hypothetical protein
MAGQTLCWARDSACLRTGSADKIALAFGISINKDVVRRILAASADPVYRGYVGSNWTLQTDKVLLVPNWPHSKQSPCLLTCIGRL